MPTRLELAEALRRAARPADALTHYRYVLERNPRMVEARYGYALALVGLKRYDEARQRLTADAKEFPERPEFAEALTKLRSR
jgi:predicted Zn-dependent protease